MTLNEHRITSTNPDESGKWQCLMSARPTMTRLAGKAGILRNFGAGLVAFRFSALKNWFSELNLPGRSFPSQVPDDQ